MIRRLEKNPHPDVSPVSDGIVKTLYGFTYEELAFHTVDSQSLRWFCRIGIAEEGFRKSVLNRNIKAISEHTWEMINRSLLGYAKDEKIEKGREVRTDCTCVESNIHEPTDSSLLCDCVRVLTRLIKQGQKELNIKVPGFSNHNRRAKRRMLAIMNAKKKKKRKTEYIDLIKTTEKVLGYARAATGRIMQSWAADKALELSESICHYADLTEKVIGQTRRRVLSGEGACRRKSGFDI